MSSPKKNPYRFLGIPHENVGPFGLLGISPEQADPSMIDRSMRLQLARIDAHPESRSREAHALREEIRVAAELLLDPETLATLREEYERTASVESHRTCGNRIRRGTTQRPDHPPTTPPSPSPPPITPPLSSFDPYQMPEQGTSPSKSADPSHKPEAQSLKQRDQQSRKMTAKTKSRSSESTLLGSASARSQLVAGALLSSGGLDAGGWRQLASLASMYQMTPEQLWAEFLRETGGIEHRESEWSGRVGDWQPVTGQAPKPEPCHPTETILTEEEEERLAERQAMRNLTIVLLTFLVGLIITFPFGLYVLSEYKKVVRDREAMHSPTESDLPPINEIITPDTDSSPDKTEESTTRRESLPLTYSQALDRLRQQMSSADGLNAELMGRYRSLMSQAQESWLRLNRASRDRIQQFGVDVFYEKATNSADATALLTVFIPSISVWLTPDDKIVRTSDTLTAYVWSGGMLGVLANEDGLPGPCSVRVDELWNRVVGTQRRTLQITSFNEAAEIMLPRVLDEMILMLSASPDESLSVWQTWWELVEAVCDGQPDQCHRMIGQALGRLFLDGPELTTSESSREAMAVLLEAIDWSIADEPKRSIAAGFDDLRISSGDLSVLTGYLVANRLISGLDETYVLAPDADTQARAKMRARLHNAWPSVTTADTPLSKELVVDWITRTKRLISEPLTQNTESELEYLAQLVHMNQAAGLLEADRGEDSTNLLNESRHLISQAQIGLSPTDPSTNHQTNQPDQRTSFGSDGQWSLHVAHAGQVNNRDRQIELIHSLAANGNTDLGPVDTATLVDLVFHGGSGLVRLEALKLIEKQLADGPTVLLMFMDTLPQTTRDLRLSQAIELMTGATLPHPRTNQWYAAARVALLEKVIQLRSTMRLDQISPIDTMSDLISASYVNRAAILIGARQPVDASSNGSTSDTNDGAIDTLPIDSAVNCYEAWLHRAKLMLPMTPIPTSLDEIAEHGEVRSALHDDPFGAFLSTQQLVLETAMYVTAAERPDSAQALLSILDQMYEEQSDQTTSVFEQMIAVERAMCRVWMIRLGGTSASQNTDTFAGHARTKHNTDSGRSTESNLISYEDLSRLQPDDPVSYFRLGEKALDVRDYDPARRLLTLAAVLDPDDLGTSACLALAEMARMEGNAIDEAYFSAIARLFPGEGVHQNRAGIIEHHTSQLETASEVAFLFGSCRRGFGNAVHRVFGNASQLDLLLSMYPDLQPIITRCLRWCEEHPSCPSCKNAGVVDCPVCRGGTDPGQCKTCHRLGFGLCRACRGQPGMILSDEEFLSFLMIEQALLGGSSASWSAQYELGHGQHRAILSPSHLADYVGIDARLTVYRDGRWVGLGDM